MRDVGEYLKGRRGAQGAAHLARDPLEFRRQESSASSRRAISRRRARARSGGRDRRPVPRAAHDAVETLLKKYGKRVIEKQYHQERLANIAIDLFAGSRPCRG